MNDMRYRLACVLGVMLLVGLASFAFFASAEGSESSSGPTAEQLVLKSVLTYGTGAMFEAIPDCNGDISTEPYWLDDVKPAAQLQGMIDARITLAEEAAASSFYCEYGNIPSGDLYTDLRADVRVSLNQWVAEEAERYAALAAECDPEHTFTPQSVEERLGTELYEELWVLDLESYRYTVLLEDAIAQFLAVRELC